MVLEPTAGLVQIYMKLDNIPVALTWVDKILDFIGTNTLDGSDDPGGVYLECVRALETVGDPRARDLLEKAHKFLQTRQGTIEDDEARSSFDERIPSHRHLTELFEAQK
jgi:hypothetical protein